MEIDVEILHGTQFNPISHIRCFFKYTRYTVYLTHFKIYPLDSKENVIQLRFVFLYVAFKRISILIHASVCTLEKLAEVALRY